jgi:tRNA(Ile)-lysidine synthase
MRLQDLPRHLARRCLGIPRFCAESLGVELRGTRLVVAYSAGLDSTALLHLLHLLHAPLKLTLFAAHAHHGLRQESDRELEHSMEVCTRLGIPCETMRLDVASLRAASGGGLEECARKARYAFLDSVRRDKRADWIVTAHHGDDLAEDIVMRLVRGTGWPGLGGMPGVDRQRHLLRPLLDWEKCELRAFLEETGTAWCEDLSNSSTDRTRNRVRHDILPLLRRENPAFAKTARQLVGARPDRWRLLGPDPAIPPPLPSRSTFWRAANSTSIRPFACASTKPSLTPWARDRRWRAIFCSSTRPGCAKSVVRPFSFQATRSVEWSLRASAFTFKIAPHEFRKFRKYPNTAPCIPNGNPANSNKLRYIP